MNFKKFLKPSSERHLYYWVKPDWRKIVIFVILLVLFSYHIFGFPLKSVYMIGGCEGRNGKMVCWDAETI